MPAPNHDDIVRPIGPTHDEIATRAHELWEQSGRRDGQDVTYWLLAEGELRAEREKNQQPDGEPGTLSTHTGLEPTAKSSREQKR
jgi:hypothetical protein